MIACACGRGPLLRILAGSIRNSLLKTPLASPRSRSLATGPVFQRVSPGRWAGGLLNLDMAASSADPEVSSEEDPRQQQVDYTGLPKVELHIHMDGACRVSTLRDLSRQYGLDYPHGNEEEFKRHVMISSPAQSLEDFLKVFGALSNILCTKEALERVAYEYCEEMKRQNVVYFECRYYPMGHGMEPEDYIEGVIAGLERGERDFGVKSRHILAFLRHAPEHVSRMVDLAVKYKSRGVVAVDIAGNERLPMDQRFVDGFTRAKKEGLRITAHAGESGPADNVRQAIEVLGAERIGHGYHVLEDDSIYQLAREKKVHFEACLTSSIFTNCQPHLDSTHAIRRWAEDGTSFSLNTDDPGVIGNDLLKEYRDASQSLGLSKKQLVQSVLDGVAAAFLPDNEKAELLAQVKEGIAQWERCIS